MNDQMKSAGHWGLLALAGTFFLVTGGINKIKENGYIGKSPDYTRTIFVSGESRVSAVPDVAKLSFGYTVNKTSVAEAQKDNVDKMNAFMKVLENKNIDKKDFKTTNYSVYPEYNYVNGRQEIRGYTVSQNIEVTLRGDTMNQAQSLLALAAENGLNQVGGLQFTVDKPETYMAQARAEAIKKAQESAKSIADNAGLRLGKVMNYSESGAPTPTPYPYYADKAVSGMGGGGAPEPSINPGTNEIYMSVSLTYEIQ